MEFTAIRAALDLNPMEWSLLQGFFGFGHEPYERLSHLCQMEPEQVEKALPGLVSRGIVRAGDDGSGGDSSDISGKWYGLAPLDEWLTAAEGGDPDLLNMEKAMLVRVRRDRDLKGVTICASRDVRDRAGLDPDVLAYTSELMPYVDLRLGSKCNLNCVYCLLGHENRYYRRLEEIVDDLSLARRQNIERVSLTGGEPTIHPDILRVVTAARAMGFRKIILVTNGLTLSYPGVLKRIVDAGVTAVGVSFDTPDRETAEELWKAPVFDRVLKAFEALADFPDLTLGTISVLTTKNIGQVEDLARFFLELAKTRSGPFVPNLDFIMPEENAWLYRKELVPRLLDVVEPVRRALKIAHDGSLPLTFRGIPPCLLPGMERYSFDRYMQILRLVRDAREGPVDNVSIEMLRSKAPACRACRLRKECTGVSRSYANLYGTDELHPIEVKP
ncbi:MAG: radical SAM protein [Deltaproteobacteria bacterium]|nr:radical SAM protein [Deltaproteobacteria bacterium]